MDCPYPGCGGTVRAAERQTWGFCEKCREPAILCQEYDCGATNQALARYCRLCRALLEARSVPLSPRSYGRPTSVVEVPGAHRAAPLPFCGSLWFLVDGGNVYRLSPFGNAARLAGDLGSGFGGSSFTFSALTTEQGQERPHLVALSRNAVGVLDLLRGQTRALPAQAGEEILCDLGEGFFSHAVRTNTIYYLVRSPAGLFALRASGLEGTRTSAHSLSDGGLPAGPFAIGEGIGLYTPTTMYLLDSDGRFSALQLPGEFNALKPNSPFPIHLPPRSHPYLVRGDEVVIPGSQGGKAGLLRCRKTKGTMVFAFSPLPKGSYALASDGKLILLNGPALYEDSILQEPFLRDAELSPACPPLRHHGTVAAFAESMARVRQGVVFSDGQRVGAFQVSADEEGRFFAIANALLFSITAGSTSKVRVATWGF